MVHIETTPEADASASRIPREVLREFTAITDEWASLLVLKLPGSYNTHKLRDSRDLWTLKLPEGTPPPDRDYRCVYQWTGSEIVLIRYGHWKNVYEHLPR